MKPFVNMKEWAAAGEAQALHENKEWWWSCSCYFCSSATSWYIFLFIMLPVWSNYNHVPWSLYFSWNFHPQYGLLSYSEILCPLNPLTSTSHPTHSCAFSVLLGLWWVVLPLAGVPEEQWDADGGQSHHAECSPVELENRDMGMWVRCQGTVQKRNKTCIFHFWLQELPLKKNSLRFCLYCRRGMR